MFMRFFTITCHLFYSQLYIVRSTFKFQREAPSGWSP